jgi:hypothetical protein
VGVTKVGGARDVRGDWCQHCSRFCFLFLALDGVGLVCRGPWTSLLKPTKGADWEPAHPDIRGGSH